MIINEIYYLFQVSWMRKRDMHILSAGTLMYTSDLRFQVIHPEKSENWTLQIKSPQERDSGVYECQVSTEPKMSLNYSLNVIGKCYLNYSRIWPGYVNRNLASIYLRDSLSIGGADDMAVDRLLSHGKDCSRHEPGSKRLKFKRLSAPSQDYPLVSRRVAKSSSFRYYSKLDFDISELCNLLVLYMTQFHLPMLNLLTIK